MEIPSQFRELSRYFDQDIVLVAKNGDEMVAYALRNFKSGDRQIVKEYLTDLLAQNPSDETLTSIWDGLDSDIFITRGIRHIFTLIRDAA